MSVLTTSFVGLVPDPSTVGFLDSAAGTLIAGEGDARAAEGTAGPAAAGSFFFPPRRRTASPTISATTTTATRAPRSAWRRRRARARSSAARASAARLAARRALVLLPLAGAWLLTGWVSSARSRGVARTRSTPTRDESVAGTVHAPPRSAHASQGGRPGSAVLALHCGQAERHLGLPDHVQRQELAAQLGRIGDQ